MAKTQELKVITLDHLKKLSSGQIIQLPGYTKDEPITVKVRRPSILGLAKAGKIPNNLLTSANELFAKGTQGFNEKNENALKETLDVLEIFCEEMLIEPTMKDLRDNDIQLTDEQMMELFKFMQRGIESLTFFRKDE